MLKIARRSFLTILIVTLSLALAPCAQNRAAQSSATQAAPQTAQNFLILISNDDGVNAPGIRALTQAMQGAGEIVIAAPASEQSGKGHSLTLREPLTVTDAVHPSGAKGWAIEASPASCVMLALHSLLGDRRPDLVISGINRGDNAGLSLYVSGTLGAAREAAFAGIPAIAVSMDLEKTNGREEAHYQKLAGFVRQLVDDLRAKKIMKSGLFLNVNGGDGDIKGSMVVRMTTSRAKNWFDRDKDKPNVYRSRYQPLPDDVQGTDVWAMKRGFVAITPLGLDNTDAKAVKPLRKIEKKAAAAAAK